MRKKIKVMQIIPNLKLGGAEVMVENLSVSLIDKGYDVEIVSLYSIKTPITERLNKKGIKITFLDKKSGFDFKIMIKLMILIFRNKPKVIHTHLHALKYSLLGSMLLKNTKKIHTIHSIANKDASRLNILLNKIIFRYFSFIPVSISPQVKESILKEYKLKEDYVPMIFNGIDLNSYNKKTKYDINLNTPKIIHVGNFKEAKNHIKLVESFAMVFRKYPLSKLVLIGNGLLMENVKDKVKELNLKDGVIFLGEQSTVQEYLSHSDIFILPSLWEGMPISLIEAMATGLPIVATSVGGISDMISNNENGLLVSNSSEEISLALIKLIENQALRQRLGEKAFKSSEHYTAIFMADSYAEIYFK